MSTTEIRYRLAIDGAGQVQAGLAGVSEAFAVSATDALKLEKATAATAAAQSRLDAAVARSAAAQAAYAAASKDASISQATLADLAQKAAAAQASQSVASVKLREQASALKTLEDAHRGVATQTKLTGMQSAQLSAQLQDLFVQIQAGGNPMTALIQQGSQLSAVFGGVGPALRAVLSVFSPAVVAAASLAAVVGTLGLAWVAGRRESAQFRADLALTNNAAGVTADGVRAMADRIGKDTKAGIGTAREALSVLIASGRVSGDALQYTASAAAALSRATGESAEDIAKRFVGMSDNVADSARKLNQQYNFLSVAQYQQIKQLEDQGNAQSALALTMQALSGQVGKTVQELGTLETAWLDVANAMSSVKSGLLEIGRDDSPAQRLAAIRGQLAELKKAGQSGYVFGPSVAELQKQAALLQAEIDLAAKLAKGDAEAASKREAALKFEEKIVAAMTEQEKLQKRTNDLAGQAKAAGIPLTDPKVKAVLDNALVSSAAYSQATAQAQARVDAAATITGAKIRANVQEIQHLYDMGTIRHAEYLERLADADIKALQAEKARLVQQRASAANRASLGDESARATVSALGGQIDEKDFDIKTRRLKLTQDLELAKYKEAKAIRDASQALREEGEVQTNQMIEQQTVQRNALVRSIEDYRVAVLESIESTSVEAAALGQSDRQRRILIEQFRIELDLRKRIRDIQNTPFDSDAARQAAISSARAVANAAKANVPAIVDNDEFEKLKQKLIDSTAGANDLGTALREAFGGAGDALAKLTGSLSTYARQQQEFAKDRARIDAIEDPEKRAQLQIALGKRVADAQIDSYADMAGAAKGFFREGTTGYKALEAAETAFRAFQLASNAAAAAKSIAESFKVGAASAGPAVIKEGSISGLYGALAMAALVASLGFATAGVGGNGAPDVAKRQAATGTGTVFGDATAKSESMANALEQLKDTARLELPIQSAMLRSLESIDSSMAGLASLIARSAGLTTGKNLGIFEGTLSVNEGDPILKALGINDSSIVQSLADSGSILGKLGVLGQSLFGKVKQNVTDSGLNIQATVADLIKGIGVQQYADVTTTSSSWFGLKKSVNTDTVLAPVQDQIAQQFGLIFKNVGESIKLAAGALGQDSAGIGDAVANSFIDIAKLSLKDLKGQDLQDAISAAIGAQADQIAATVLPGLGDFQKVGEGYFETLVRVASGVETADQALSRFGVTAVSYTDVLAKQGDVAAEIVRQSIVKVESTGGALSGVGQIIDSITGSAGDLADTYAQLQSVQSALRSVGISGDALSINMLKGAGSIDALQSSLGDYLQGFFTEQERFQASAAELTRQFSALGVTAIPQTRDQFRALVEGLAAAGPASAELLAKVLGLAGAFDSAASAAKSIADKQSSLQIAILRTQGDEYAALALERQAELNAAAQFGDGIVLLTQQLFAAEDAAKKAAIAQGTLAASSAALKSQRQAQVDAKQTADIYSSISQADIIKALSPGQRAIYDATGTLPAAIAGAVRNGLAIAKFDALGAAPNLAAGSVGQSLRASGSESVVGNAAQELQRQQVSATEDLIRQLDSLEQSLTDYMDSLLTSDLSPLSPKEQYDQARALLTSVASEAVKGNLQAAGAAQSAVEQFLRSSEAYNARGTVYTSDFNLSRDLLAQIRAVMERVEANTKQTVQATAASGEAIAGAVQEGNEVTAQSLAYQSLAV